MSSKEQKNNADGKEKGRKMRWLEWTVGLMARLPFWVLYLLSDLTYLLLFHVVRYRRKVVMENLSKSFPDKSEHQLRDVQRRFYRNFSDYIFETIKLLHISDKQMRKRMTFEGVEITDRYLSEGRPVVVYFSHCGNWEWAPSVTLWSKFGSSECSENGDSKVAFCQIYRPLRSKAMDELMLRIRGRFGSVSLTKRMAFLDLMRYRRQGIATMTGFMSDQKPSHGDMIHVVNFLHHPTAIITGTETAARRLNAAVVYWDMHKPRRGHYHIVTKLITDTPAELPEFAITDRYASLLAQTIRREPAIWLWTHKRWKMPVTMADDGTQIPYEY